MVQRQPLALLIDDLDEIRANVRERMTANGFRVVEANSGEAGLAALALHPVDVVVLDVGLPGLDGFAVLRTIRETSNVPVIMLTGADHEADKVLGLELGADDYVLKPFSARELVARVRAVLRRATPSPTVPAAGDERVLSFRRLRLSESRREIRACYGNTIRHFNLGISREFLHLETYFEGMYVPNSHQTDLYERATISMI